MLTANASVVDVCLSDYWSGHHLPHIQVPVWHGMHIREFRDACMDELRHGAVAGSDDNARLLSGDMVKPEEEKRADAVTSAVYAAIRRDIRHAIKGKRKLFMDLEPRGEDDDSDTVYAFVVFTINE